MSPVLLVKNEKGHYDLSRVFQAEAVPLLNSSEKTVALALNIGHPTDNTWPDGQEKHLLQLSLPSHQCVQVLSVLSQALSDLYNL